MPRGYEPNDVFSAIATPVRRAILSQLAQRDLGVTKLAASFDMTLPAVSQHLAVLRDAGLVKVRKQGKERIYQIQAEPLKEVAKWVETYEKFWTGKLAALGEYLEETR